MPPSSDWVLLTYRLPRHPSTPRITVWRKLQRLGVAQLADGVVALPADRRTKEQLEWLAEEVLEAGGGASVWTGRPLSRADERRLAERMAAEVADEYRAVTAEAERLATTGHVDGRSLARLRRQLQRIGKRDFFPPAERDEAHASVQHLATVHGALSR